MKFTVNVVCILILAILPPSSIRADLPEKSCNISWEIVGKFLGAKNLQELESTAFREDGWPVMTDEGAWIVYGLRLRDFGRIADSDRIIAPRIPLDIDRRNCLFQLIYVQDNSLADPDREKLTRFAFETFYSPEILNIAARADLLDRGFRYYMMGADGELGEAMYGCNAERGDTCPAGETSPDDVCRNIEFKPAVKAAFNRLDQNTLEKLADRELFPACFRAAGLNAAHIRKPPDNYKAFYETDTTSLWGVLIKRSFYGPPGYGEDPKHDSRGNYFLLKLDAPLAVTSRGGNDLSEPESGISELQLVLDKKGYAQLRPYLNRTIKVRGKLFHSHTSHHHTKVLMESVTLANHP